MAPLLFPLMGTDRTGQGFWTDFSVALGFVGLTLMGIEFALVARVRTFAVPFGTDAVIDFHQSISVAYVRQGNPGSGTLTLQEQP